MCLECLKTLEWLELRWPGGGWQEMVSCDSISDRLDVLSPHWVEKESQGPFPGHCPLSPELLPCCLKPHA